MKHHKKAMVRKNPLPPPIRLRKHAHTTTELLDALQHPLETLPPWAPRRIVRAAGALAELALRTYESHGWPVEDDRPWLALQAVATWVDEDEARSQTIPELSQASAGASREWSLARARSAVSTDSWRQYWRRCAGMTWDVARMALAASVTSQDPLIQELGQITLEAKSFLEKMGEDPKAVEQQVFLAMRHALENP